MYGALLPWLMWLVVSLFYAYQYILRVSPAVLMPYIVEGFGITPEDFGMYNAAYYFGYTVIHIPIGILLDKFGARRMILISVLFAVFGSLPLVCSMSWGFVVVGRAIVGVGSAGAALGMLKVIRISFSSERFAFMLGITLMIGVMGAVAGGAPMNTAVNVFGMERTLVFLMLLGAVVFVAGVFVLPGLHYKGKQYSEDAEVVDQSIKGMCKDVISIITNPMIVMISLIGGMMIGPLEGFSDAWSIKFFTAVYGFTNDSADWIPILAFVGFGVGSLVIGYLTAKTKKYYTIIVCCAFFMLYVFYLFYTAQGNVVIYFGEHGVNLLCVALFFVGFASSYQLAILDKVLTFVSVRLTAIASATTNMIMMACGSVYHILIGKMLLQALNAAGIDPRGTQGYSAEALRYSMLAIPVGIALALVVLLAVVFIEKTLKKSLVNVE